ncbi:MAG: DNA recombination/repair protein RecA, partial [Alphaproteobacteria bacterium]
RENAKQFLRENPDIADQIERTVREQAGVLSEQALETGLGTEEAGEPLED